MTQVIARDPELDFADGDPDFWGDGGPQPRCLWNEGVCTQPPTHFLAWRQWGEDGEIDPFAETLCGRHYVLSIRKMMAEHSCTGHTAAAHLAGWGSI